MYDIPPLKTSFAFLQAHTLAPDVISVKATSKLSGVENENSMNIENVCYARVSSFSHTPQCDRILTAHVERVRAK